MTPISLYIDADACPVKQEIYRAAEHQVQGSYSRNSRRLLPMIPSPQNVMAGLVPAIHVFEAAEFLRRGCPRQARA
ncbi:MAG: hypothetical protein WB760_07420 [Xanthobacteraceae bacterium]